VLNVHFILLEILYNPAVRKKKYFPVVFIFLRKLISLIDIFYRIFRSFPITFALLLYYYIIIANRYLKHYLICKNAYVITKLASNFIYLKKLLCGVVNYVCRKKKRIFL